MSVAEQVKLSVDTELDELLFPLMDRYPNTLECTRTGRNGEVEYVFEDAQVFAGFLNWANDNLDTLPDTEDGERLAETLGFWSEELASHSLAQNPREPNTEAQSVAQKYARDMGFPAVAETPYVKVDPARARLIADLFESTPDNSDAFEVVSAYEQLAAEVEGQFKYLPVQVLSTAEFGAYPYNTSQDLVDDIRLNKRMVVFDGGEDHALLTREQNFKFRAVHDYFGHAAKGYEFGPRGEENAWIEHSKLFSPLARQALTTETRGQNSWVNFGPYADLPSTERPYAPQKAFILPPWVQTHEVFEAAYADNPEWTQGPLRDVLEAVEMQGIAANPPDEQGFLFEPVFMPRGVKRMVKEAKKTGEKKRSLKYLSRHREDIYANVMVYFEEGKDGMHWYEETPKRIRAFFNDDERADLFIGFLAATSPLRNIKRNVQLALKALAQFDQGARLAPEYMDVSEADFHSAKQHGAQGYYSSTRKVGKKKETTYKKIICPPRASSFSYVDRGVKKADIAAGCALPGRQCCFNLDMPNHETNAARVARGEPLTGEKVSAFYRNLTQLAEFDDGVTVDTWMLRAFSLRTTGEDDAVKESSGAPTDAEYRVVEEAVRELASTQGVSPRQFQAAVWVGIKRILGDVSKDTDEPFEVVLEREAEKTARQQVFADMDEGDPLEVRRMRAERFARTSNPGPTEGQMQHARAALDKMELVEGCNSDEDNYADSADTWSAP
jgi:hypothetical protein